MAVSTRPEFNRRRLDVSRRPHAVRRRVGAPAVTEADLIRFVNAQAEVYSQVISAAGCMARAV